MARLITVLTDRSKDSSGAGLFGEILPHTEFGRTTNTGPLSPGLLAAYDVLAICGQSLKRYSRAELEAIEGFVSRGGGLLLAADAGVFEAETGLPAARMAQSAVAEMLGAAFVDSDVAGARMDHRLCLRLPAQRLSGARHPALQRDGLELAAHGGACLIEAPAGSEVLLSLRGGGHACAAAFAFGEGRVVMVGARDFAHDRPLTCRTLARWLGIGADRRKSAGAVPQRVGPGDKVSEDPRCTCRYDPGCERLVPKMRRELAAVMAAIEERFGEIPEPRRSLRLIDTATPYNPWGWSSDIGTQGTDGQRVRRLVADVVQRDVVYSLHHRALPPLFTAMPTVLHLADKVLRDLGHTEEAERIRERADRWLAEADTHARTYDLACSYEATDETCPRGLMLLRELEQAEGDGIYDKLALVMPKKATGPHPQSSYVWAGDRSIYYLSLAAGKDLFPWFAQRGLTVHPAPIAKPEAKSYNALLWARLQEAARDEAETLGSRMDAVLDLAAMRVADKDGKLKHQVRDDWSALVDALVHSRRADKQAHRLLSALTVAGKPEPVRAIAGIALADLGDASGAADLVTLARTADVRFRLAAWYALEKAGSALAEELSPDRSGVAIETRDRGYLLSHAMVDGHRVANNLSQPTLHPFTRDACTTVHEVHWVHTADTWRRRGLSRYLFEQAMTHPEAMACSLSHLWTGTRNVAHALYREYGFIDMAVANTWTCECPGRAGATPPTDVVLRAFKETDRPRVDEFLREVKGKAICFDGLHACDAGATVHGFVAIRGAKVVGYASVGCEHPGKEADIGTLAVAEGDNRDGIADGLLSLLTTTAAGKGAKSVIRRNGDEHDYISAALQRAGYALRRHSGVMMLQIRHLHQFLQEIAPALESRLLTSHYKDWEGTVDLLGERLQARVAISKGKAKAGKPGATPPDVSLTGSDDAITHIALGRKTPFEAYLQTELTIGPRINERLSGLVEVLFPKVEVW